MYPNVCTYLFVFFFFVFFFLPSVGSPLQVNHTAVRTQVCPSEKTSGKRKICDVTCKVKKKKGIGIMNQNPPQTPDRKLFIRVRGRPTKCSEVILSLLSVV